MVQIEICRKISFKLQIKQPPQFHLLCACFFFATGHEVQTTDFTHTYKHTNRQTPQVTRQSLFLVKHKLSHKTHTSYQNSKHFQTAQKYSQHIYIYITTHTHKLNPKQILYKSKYTNIKIYTNKTPHTFLCLFTAFE